MNKVTKGTLAAAAAGALLLGGAGTYALWEDNETLKAGAVASGHLELSSTTKGWSFDGINHIASPINPDDVVAKIVPGDTLTAVYDVKIDASGDNIQGELLLAGISDDLAGDVTVDYTTVQNASNDPQLSVSLDGNTYSFAKAGVYNVSVTVGITYKKEATAQLTAAEWANELNISGLSLTLNQTTKL